MKVGTRESKLAMRQTEIFCSRMAETNPDIDCEVVGLKSLGDIDLTSPLNQMAATGAFVRELDEAMKQGAIDCSVNSLKDIPIDVDPELMVVWSWPSSPATRTRTSSSPARWRSSRRVPRSARHP